MAKAKKPVTSEKPKKKEAFADVKAAAKETTLKRIAEDKKANKQEAEASEES